MDQTHGSVTLFIKKHFEETKVVSYYLVQYKAYTIFRGVNNSNIQYHGSFPEVSARN